MLKDADIRDPLFWFLEEKYGKVRFFEELVMGDSRADGVMVTQDMLYGIEIKSDADSYTRLKTQIEDYDRFFDRNYIVVGRSHLRGVEEHIPYNWGIIVVREEEGKAVVELLREPEEASPVFVPGKKLQLLWRQELAHILRRNGVRPPSKGGKPALRKLVRQKVPKDLLPRLICEELFERDYTQFEE